MSNLLRKLQRTVRAADMMDKEDVERLSHFFSGRGRGDGEGSVPLMAADLKGERKVKGKGNPGTEKRPKG